MPKIFNYSSYDYILNNLFLFNKIVKMPFSTFYNAYLQAFSLTELFEYIIYICS